MQVLDTIKLYMTLSLLLVILIIISVFVIFVLASRKKGSMTEIYYDSFDRHDSMEYLKFDKIISSNPMEPLKGAGTMVVNQRTFVGIINVVGYDFFTAPYEKQAGTINAAISLMDSLECPISLRQTVKAINISHNIQEFEKRARIISDEIRELETKIREYVEDAEDYLDEKPELSREFLDEADKFSAKAERKRRQFEEAREMIRYMGEISTQSGNTQKVQNIVFSYTYDGSQFTTQLTKEEIYLQAMQELDNMAAGLISGLYRCGCIARRLSAEEIVDLNRRHMHPATCDDDTVQDLFDSSLGALFVTSDSLLSVVREQMTEEAYAEQIRIVEEKIAAAEKKNRLLGERAEADRMEVTRKIAGSQINIDK